MKRPAISRSRSFASVLTLSATGVPRCWPHPYDGNARLTGASGTGALSLTHATTGQEFFGLLHCKTAKQSITRSSTVASRIRHNETALLSGDGQPLHRTEVEAGQHNTRSGRRVGRGPRRARRGRGL